MGSLEKSIDQTVEGCPAFAKDSAETSKCPFAFPKDVMEMDPASIPQHLKLAVEKCPEFKESCPFSSSKTMQDVYDKLSTIPASHMPKDGGPAAKAFQEMMEYIHSVSKEKSEEVGDCPIFALDEGGCPFKNVCANGRPLVVELDIRSFSIASSMAQDEAGTDTPLSKFIKQGTKKSHREAESVLFVKNFIKGRIKKELYVTLIQNLYFVYDALEAEITKHKDVMGELYQPEKLARKEPLFRDMVYFKGEQWLDAAAPSTATNEYIQRIHDIADQEPLLLAAHAYTRYLGDLSGGQTLKRVAVKALQLPKEKGTEFYEFVNMPEGAKAFKQAYRRSMDQMKLPAGAPDRLVGEANVAFVLNMRLFEELDVAAGEEGASVRPLQAALDYFDAVNDPADNNSNDANKCPFLSPATAKAKTVQTADLAKAGNAAKCPFPFILLHDPKAALDDPKAWATLLVIIAMLVYQLLLK